MLSRPSFSKINESSKPPNSSNIVKMTRFGSKDRNLEEPRQNKLPRNTSKLISSSNLAR